MGMAKSLDPLSLENNCKFETPLKDPSGEPEPGCFSSWGQFRYRALEFLARWKYILCC
jgi:hypothetical protein